jgi:CheY-like chemotaxis protein
MHKAICAFTLTLVAMLSKRVMERKRYNWRCDRLGCSLMDGFDLVRHVRTGDRNERDSKIVMLTAYDGPDYIETARNVGCDVVLPKPLISRTSKSPYLASLVIILNHSKICTAFPKLDGLGVLLR